jgi:hypothetical protein
MLQNSRGQSIDPVPFVVVTGMTFLWAYSFFPLYLQTLGVGVPIGLAVATLIFLPLAAFAYYRLVWNAQLEIRTEVSPGLRFEQIMLQAIIVTGLCLVLTVVLLA